MINHSCSFKFHEKDFIDVLEFGHNPRIWRTNINLHKSFFFTMNTIRAKSKDFCYVEIQIIGPLSGPVYKRKNGPGLQKHIFICFDSNSGKMLYY